MENFKIIIENKDHLLEIIILSLILLVLNTFLYKITLKLNLNLNSLVVLIIIVIMNIMITGIIYLNFSDFESFIKSLLLLRWQTLILIIIVGTNYFIFQYLEKLKKQKIILMTLFCLNIFGYIFYFIFTKLQYFCNYDLFFIIMTLMSVHRLFFWYIEPIAPQLKEKITRNAEKLNNAVLEVIISNRYLNKIMFFRNFITMVINNVYLNNWTAVLMIIIFVSITGYFIVTMNLIGYLYFLAIFSIFNMLNEILCNRYATNKKFRSNFDKNILEVSRVIYSVTRQNEPIKLKIISRNMAKLSILGHGFIEGTPSPKVAQGLIKLGALGVICLTGVILHKNEGIEKTNRFQIKTNAELENRRMDIENRRMDIEQKRMDIEKIKAEKRWWK